MNERSSSSPTSNTSSCSSKDQSCDWLSSVSWLPFLESASSLQFLSSIISQFAGEVAHHGGAMHVVLTTS